MDYWSWKKGTLIVVLLFCLCLLFVVPMLSSSASPLRLEVVLASKVSSMTGESDRISLHLPAVRKAWAANQGSLLISEVLYDPAQAEPDGEWIEIYNPGEYSVDLAEYKIGDEEARNGREGMYRFPVGASIEPGTVVVVANKASVFKAHYGFRPDYELRESDLTVPTLGKYSAWSGGNIVLLNSSDEVLLLNDQDKIVDALSWGASLFAFDPPAPDVPVGHSLERVPGDLDTDSATDWVDQSAPEPGAVDLSIPTPSPSPTLDPTLTPPGTHTATPGPSPTPTPIPTPFGGVFLITETLYDPLGQEPDGEWIELYNPGSFTIDLWHFKVGDEETQGGGEGMVRFPHGAVANPSQIIIVAKNAQAFEAFFGFFPDFELADTEPSVPEMEMYPNWASGNVSLGNAGDEVLIIDGADQLVDALSWGTSTFAFDPPAPDVPAGHSLARVPADQDNNSADDWVDQETPDPGNVILVPPNPTPTPTPTWTASPVPSLTSTPTPTASPTQTPTPSPTKTPTWTQSPSPTLTPSPSDTPTGTQPPGQVDYLLISEVFYDTPGVDSQEEWIEIYNPTNRVVDLSENKIGDEETPGGGEGMFQFPVGALIAPGEKVVVALQATGFFALYGFQPDYEISDTDPTVLDMVPYPVWGSGLIGLSNAGDEILLLDVGDNPVDVVTYENGTFPGVVPHPGVNTGHSIERWPPDQDTDDCSLDFIDQPVPNPNG